MRNRISVAVSALALLCTLLAAPITRAGESAHQFAPALYWFCQSSTVPPAYTSAVVMTVANGTTNEAILPQLAATKRDIEQSFADFLAKKYAYTGLSSCLSSESQYWMESNRNERLETLRTRNLQIVETGWVYAAAASAPAATAPVPPAQGLAHNAATGAGTAPAPAAAAPVPAKPTAPATSVKPATAAIVAAAQTPYAFCFGEVMGLHPAVYFGVPFKAPVRNTPAWSAAYKEFLIKKYRFAGLVHCPSQKSQAEALQQARKVEDRYVARWTVVETGWKYR